MEASNVKAMRKALTDLVNYLNEEIKRTSKCKRCKYRGKTFRSEPCYWHVDCGIEEYDKKASDNAMRLLKRFKLQEALAAPPRNCDRMPDIDKLTIYDLAKSPCKSTLECASREELLALVRWFLSPATKKGGEK